MNVPQRIHVEYFMDVPEEGHLISPWRRKVSGKLFRWSSGDKSVKECHEEGARSVERGSRDKYQDIWRHPRTIILDREKEREVGGWGIMGHDVSFEFYLDICGELSKDIQFGRYGSDIIVLL